MGGVLLKVRVLCFFGFVFDSGFELGGVLYSDR